MALVLHLLMLSLFPGGSARVVTDFEQECGGFFANGKSPTRFYGPQYRQICQTLNGVDYYATYYDTRNKIPVYSVYRFEEIKRCKRQKKWYIEPQLDDNNAGENMAFSRTVKNSGKHQALNQDYKNSGSDKGHLAPVYQARSQRCADATFTLTNTAPQNHHFNSGKWRVLEAKMAKELSEQCPKEKNTVYIVTGVVPGLNKIGKNKDVNVPSHFWSAYCCLDQNNRCSFSGGVIGTNDNNAIIKTMETVALLEEELKNLYGTTFRLFEEQKQTEVPQNPYGAIKL